MVTSSLVLCHAPRPRQHLWLEPQAPLASLLDGVEGLAVLPIRLQTGYELQFFVDAYGRAHTDSNQIFPHDCNATIATIAAISEEPDVLRHSGASSSSNHAAEASRVPTVLDSLGNCLWKQLEGHVSVDSRNSIPETGADLDRNRWFPLF